MPKKVKKTTKKTAKNSSKKKDISYGAIAGIFLVSLFILYVGFNNIKSNNVSKFEECVQSEGVTTENKPRECTLNGKTYYESITGSPPSIVQIQKGTNDIPLDIERGNYVINSNREWGRIFNGSSIMPEVNFDEKTVIAVVMGQKPSGGYSVNLRQVEVGSDHMEFMVEEIVPGESCVTPQALTNPYQIIAIEKTDKEIQFVGETTTEEC